MEINYVCSLGTRCHVAQILKNNNLKKCSYPFDWIFSDPDIVKHCIEDKFNIFLDKTYYIKLKEKMCGHSYYHPKMFNHHNPLNTNDYDYYKRCVERFTQLLQYKENKLFIMMFVNTKNFEETLKKKVIEFNDKFSKFVSNYKLLVIIHINKGKQNHILTQLDSIDFLELHTLSNSNGLNFINLKDNTYLNITLNKIYNFKIK